MKKFIVLMLILLTCPPSFSDETIKKISLKEALDIAIENNIDYQASKMNIDIAANKVKVSNNSSFASETIKIKIVDSFADVKLQKVTSFGDFEAYFD